MQNLNEIYQMQLDRGRGVDPATLQRVQQGKQAGLQADELSNSGRLASALRHQNAKLRGVQGSGLAATAPHPLEMLATLGENYYGNQSARKVQGQINALRGKEAQGIQASQDARMQEKVYEDQLAQGRFEAQQIAMQQRQAARDKEAERVRQEKIKQEQIRKTRDRKWKQEDYMFRKQKDLEAKGASIGGDLITMIDQYGDPRTITYNKASGVAKIGDRVVDISEWRNTLPTDFVNPSGKAIESYRESGAMVRELQTLSKMHSQFNKKQLGDLNKRLETTFLEMSPGEIRRLLEDTLVTDDPKVKEYYIRLAMIESRLGKLLSGTAVTLYEKSDRQNWSPNASGVNDETRQIRINALINDLSSKTNSFEDQYSDYRRRKRVSIDAPSNNALSRAEQAEKKRAEVQLPDIAPPKVDADADADAELNKQILELINASGNK